MKSFITNKAPLLNVCKNYNRVHDYLTENYGIISLDISS
ncbi:MAG: hypothetical protein ACJA1B_001778 [Polaribacter sp.]|jgi:hypothetical protein